MATAEQIKALIRSHGEGDEDQFYSIAIQVAAHAARTGHGKLAEELKALVDRARARSATSIRPVPVVQPRGELAGLLTVEYPRLRLPDMALDEAIRGRVERVLLEQRRQDTLRQHGFPPIRKLLLVGPPGTGKTMTAAVVAGELSLPLFTIQLHGLITKFMGETAAKLRLIFDAISETKAVYLFDEFDALGGQRTSGNDVGEIRRVLNSFLVFLEQDESNSVIVAATNHPDLLDRALFRRFDTVIEYSRPTPAIAEEVMRTRLATLDTARVEWPAAVDASGDLSHAEVARACEAAAKNAILHGMKSVDTAMLVAALGERQAPRS
jgi:SpoVK/Ycf46/Vps4 family AAA+-type ATPase